MKVGVKTEGKKIEENLRLTLQQRRQYPFPALGANGSRIDPPRPQEREDTDWQFV